MRLLCTRQAPSEYRNKRNDVILLTGRHLKQTKCTYFQSVTERYASALLRKVQMKPLSACCAGSLKQEVVYEMKYYSRQNITPNHIIKHEK